MYGKSNNKMNVQGAARQVHADIELTAYEKNHAVEIVKAMVKANNPLGLNNSELREAEELKKAIASLPSKRNHSDQPESEVDQLIAAFRKNRI